MSVVVTTAGYLLGRGCPWQCLGACMVDQVRFTAPWGHVVTAPRTSWRLMRGATAETRAPVSVRDPRWFTNRTRTDTGGTA
ncbi:hypothetical protein ACIRO3_34655 [Streptomyces sp. NPDC102278]|uniref:hypothetical protein n=1 Tax=Streptomyces sp. NPDC102278 TaxID=3366152 RepID=UPI00380D3E1A